MRSVGLIVKSAAVCAIALMATASVVRAADEVENPRYKVWSSFKVGSSETLEGKITMGPNEVTVTMTTTLKELVEDHATLERAVTAVVMGHDHTNPPQSETVPAKAEKREMTELPNEKIEAAGKTFDCKVIETTGNVPMGRPGAPAQTVKMKLWVSSEVPGGLVKMEMPNAMAGADAKVDYTLKSFEVK